MFNAQVAMLAAAIDQSEQRDADITTRAADLKTWLDAQTEDVAAAQLSLIAAALGYEGAGGADAAEDDLETRAARIATDMAAMTGYPGKSGDLTLVKVVAASNLKLNTRTVVNDASANTQTLPAPVNNGVLEVRNIGAGAVTVAPHAAETVDVTALAQHASHVYVSDGVNWF
jgi:hypothetical protein